MFPKIKVCKTVVSVCVYKRVTDRLTDKQTFKRNEFCLCFGKFNFSISASLQISKMASDLQLRRVNVLNKPYS